MAALLICGEICDCGFCYDNHPFGKGRRVSARASTPSLPARFDPTDLASLDDPYPTYRRLRDSGALLRGGPAQYLVTRHAEVSALLRDPRLGHEFPEEYQRQSVGDGEALAFFQRIILGRDPPAHTRLRQLMIRAFSPAYVRSLRPRIAAIVDEMLAPAADGETFDVVSRIAFPLPAQVICEILNIPRVDRDEVAPMAIDLARGFAAVVPAPQREAADRAVRWLRRYLGELLDQRRRAKGDDLLSRMLDAQGDGSRLTLDEIVDNAVFLFFAGFETTASLVATGCAALLDFPGELARLRSDRSLVPAAIEEFLRWDSPVQVTARLVHEDIEVAGRRVPRGRVLILLLGAANHDERQFTEPERIDVGRQPNPHLSFGAGPHHCLGAMLGRVEGAIALERLLGRFAVLEPAGPRVRQIGASFRTFASLPIATR
jgi:cytochrome P450